MEIQTELISLTDEQYEILELLYARRISTNERVFLITDEVTKLDDWFGNIDECMESFEEMDIYLMK